MIIDNLDKDTRDRLLSYLDLVIEKNKTLNLTRIDTREKGIPLHIEDSLSCLPEFSSSEDPFLDLGTGGGFPGVPLAIVTGRKGVLLDSIQKKAHAVEDMVSQIGLSDQLEVIGMRSEDLARERGAIFSTIVARAVSSLPALLELACPLLKDHGRLIAMRGPESTNTIESLKSLAEKLGMRFVSQRDLMIDDEFHRTICVFEKVGESTIELPRRNGLAQKKPLS